MESSSHVRDVSSRTVLDAQPLDVCLRLIRAWRKFIIFWSPTDALSHLAQDVPIAPRGLGIRAAAVMWNLQRYTSKHVLYLFIVWHVCRMTCLLYDMFVVRYVCVVEWYVWCMICLMYDTFVSDVSVVWYVCCMMCLSYDISVVWYICCMICLFYRVC